ncbi:MAG TPA: phosphoribosylpyrophosphate synthetase [Chryseosolibacter sp.]
MKSYTTLSETLNDLKKRGYSEDFNITPTCLECSSLNLQLHPEDFKVDEYHRFEGMSNPDDNAIVFAISSNDGVKGTLVDAYGVYAENLTDAMIRKLAVAR